MVKGKCLLVFNKKKKKRGEKKKEVGFAIVHGTSYRSSDFHSDCS